MVKLARSMSVLAWMIFIFILSNTPYDSLPPETTNSQQIAAHIILYTILSYLILSAIDSWRKKQEQISTFNLRVVFFVIIFSILYGISDEYHQGYVSGRFVSFLDLGFDAIGAILGVLFFYLFKHRQILSHISRSGFKFSADNKRKALLHVCCAGCGAYVSRLLKENYSPGLYFYNPNIYPKEEYDKRLSEIKMIAKKLCLSRSALFIGDYDHSGWLNKIKGHEKDQEKGERCLICYFYRLESVAKTAKENGFNYFTTTLTVSPHKDAEAINKIGSALANKYNINFLNKDFKKQDGFKKSVELSKKLKLYRQHYCGCEFSIK